MDELPNIELPEIQPGDEVIKETIRHHETTNERTLARRLALQVLYEIDSAGHDVGEVMNTQVIGYDQPISNQTATYMRELVLGVIKYRSGLDLILRKYALEFPVAQIAIIDRNILRIATYEFALFGAIPVGVAIDEAVELAKMFGAEGSSRFINGVLGSLADDPETLTKVAAEFAASRLNDAESENG